MDAIINYFSEMPSAHRSAVLIGGLTIFFLIENAVPLFDKKYNKIKHTGLNIFFTVTTIIINFLMAFILVNTSDWAVANQVGILQWLALSPIWVLIIGLPLLDLIGAWLVHFVEHKVKWMWQFHLIHHTDQYVDTTTANRHHPGESVFRFIFTTAAVLAVGAPMWLVFLYQSLSVALSQFNHSNVKMPKWLDNAILILFCTPNMHRVHHHYRQPYSDSNYGNIFSFWDRIFGTYQVVDNSKLVYGVDTYMNPKEADDLVNLLKIPFAGYRPSKKYKEEEKLS
ncbi:MAG: sterol desaturase family protein [Microscillaceae bacterium]|nr:sterol desaturase family protein [Microscillaceae bacterium]